MNANKKVRAYGLFEVRQHVVDQTDEIDQLDQTLDPTKKRGVLVVSATGDFFVPAILDGNTTDHGTTFGCEAVVSAFGTGSTSGYYYIGMHPLYTRFYYYSVGDSQLERRGLRCPGARGRDGARVLGRARGRGRAARVDEREAC